MKSGMEQKKPVPARVAAPGESGVEPADGNVDACIPERLRPDGTAAWYPRAAGPGIGVPEQPDMPEVAQSAELAALADRKVRPPKRWLAARRARGKERMPVDMTPGIEAAAVVGPTTGSDSLAGAEGSPELRPFQERECARPEDDTAGFFRPASGKGAAGESAERTVSATHLTEGVLAVTSPAREGPSRPRAGVSEAGPLVRAATAFALRAQATLFPASLPFPWVRGAGATWKVDQVRSASAPADRKEETPSEARGTSGAGRTAVDTLADARGADALRVTWFHRERRTEPVAAGRPEVDGQSAVEEARRAGPAAVVRRNPGFNATARDAGTNGVGTSGPRAGDATAPASSGEKSARAGGNVRLAGVPAVDRDVALREERTLQVADGSSAWNGGLPDMSGVVAADALRRGATHAGRGRVWSALTPAVATPAPESVPAVQVNATLRVDEEELICAVERVVTRQAQRG